MVLLFLSRVSSLLVAVRAALSRACLLLFVVSSCGCLRFFLQPDTGLRVTPDKLGLRYEEVKIPSTDGVLLRAWFFPTETPPAATVLFAHGNAENISTHFANVGWLPEKNIAVLAVDYRGYGASTGSKSIRGSIDDLRSAFDYLETRADVDAQRLFVLGQSLGGALAVTAFADARYQSRVRGFILDSTFGSYPEIASEKVAAFWFLWPFQWVPALTVPSTYDPKSVISTLSPTPLLFFHGDNDPIVPLHHGEALFHAAAEPKTFVRVIGGGHIAAFTSEANRSRVVEFLKR